MENCQIKIVLAPLQGFTDAVFRNVFARHFSGVDEAIAPFISTMGQMRIKPSRIRDVSHENNKRLPVIPQILGNNAEDFIFLAKYLHDMGHEKINWNLGCPHSKIARKNKGSGLLNHPERINAFLDTVLKQIPCALSIKMRLGRYSKDEIFNLLPILDQYPIDEIILHPRTGIQMYQGTCDIDAFEKAESQSRHQFTYNGDITDPVFFRKIHRRFPHVRSFMIGRGLIANPFLAQIIKGNFKEHNKTERIKQFHDDLFEHYSKTFSGPAHLTGRMKGIWRYLGPMFGNSRKPLKKILKSTSLSAYCANVENFFMSCPELLFPWQN